MLRLSPAAKMALRQLRRELHQHPELGFELPWTSQRVRQELEALELEVHTGIGHSGLVAVLQGHREGPCLGYRADMDALPIHEASGADYCSLTPGRMHACGHDVHTTIALGVAQMLAQHPEQVCGRRVFIFQPNEEGAPGAGPSGALAMVQDRLLDRFPMDHILALHVMPSLEVGQLGLAPQAAWAASFRFEVLLRGRSTHAAYPHQGDDLIGLMARAILALQNLPARALDPRDAALLSVTEVQAGDQFNVMPGDARFSGIIRTLDEDTGARLFERMQRELQGIAAAGGVEIDLQIHQGARLTANDPSTARAVARKLESFLPAAALVESRPQLGAEDFAEFSQRVPSVYLYLGIANPAKGITHPLHSPHFDIDEAAIPFAVEAMANLLLQAWP